jgi:hypothetical protein
MNKEGHVKGLTQEGRKYGEGQQLMTNWQSFIFLSKLYTKEEET